MKFPMAPCVGKSGPGAPGVCDSEASMDALVNPTMNRDVRAIARWAAGCGWLFLAGACAAQPAQTQQRLSTPSNQASQRYEINQTFDGRAFFKDNNVWVYTQDFADLFGMPAKYIEDVQGIAAAAFRIEDTSYRQCGFGGQANVCRKVEQCLIDLYFDESKNPLPWATEIKSQWLPWYSSMRWLRTGRPNPAHRAEVPAGVIPNETLKGALVPFADPVSKREAIFTTNARVSESSGWSMSGAMAILGYTRDFYRNLSVVNLQFGCGTFTRKTIDIRLDAKKQVFDPPIAEFNRIKLSEPFVQRIRELQNAQSEKNAIFYRSLLPTLLSTRGTASAPRQKTSKDFPGETP